MTFAKRTGLVLLGLLFIVAMIWLVDRPRSTPRFFLHQLHAAESIRDVSTAQRNYADRHPGTGYACKLEELGQLGLIGPDLADGTKSGYYFQLLCPRQDVRNASSYSIIAKPNDPGITGVYAFCADQSGVIWYSKKGMAADCLAMRQPIEEKYEQLVNKHN